MNNEQPVVEVHNLNFDYQTRTNVLDNVNLTINKGSRILLVGSNGSGKSTLLNIIAGKHFVSHESVRVLGKSAYHETPITLTYVPQTWDHTNVDICVQKLIDSSPYSKPNQDRLNHLLKILEVDPEWRLHQCSAGQRRAVQILVSLIKPCQVLLLDEVTVDLDLVIRTDFLNWLKSESTTNGTTIIYTSHIMDGMADWATQVVHLSNGTIKKDVAISKITGSLLQTIESWLREEKLVKRSLSKAPTEPRYSSTSDKFYNYWN